ncbi:hypothetical protein [Snodgrassella alvi]|uniref:hypothetical protein n=1 Tax=Snodgrassella alvi TaxID=1196083 RepID=UPI0034624332
MDKIAITFTLPTTATPEKIWPYYTEISLRQQWETDLEEFRLTGELKTGVQGMFKIQHMPAMPVTLSKVITNQEFTEEFNMPDIGLLYFSHQIVQLSKDQYALKAEIALIPDEKLDNAATLDFLKQISDDIMDKAYALKHLVEN